MNPYPEDLRKKVIEALRHGLGKGDVVRGCSVGWGSPEKEDYGGECDEFLRAA